MRKCVVIGGTGTLGSHFIPAYLKKFETLMGVHVVVFSRDELKQKNMRSALNDPRVSFVIGDIRDRGAVFEALKGASDVFHFAALKHVDTCEENPEEAIKTNVIGSMNVADAALANGVRHCILSSTDKAVDPINVYGFSKAMAERLFTEKNKHEKTKFKVYRWGNVACSRGSVIPIFADALKNRKPLTFTDRRMTRFWIKIDDAVKFMLDTYQTNGSLAVPENIKSAPVISIATAIAKHLLLPAYDVKEVGIRRGEKLHEVLFSAHDESRPVTDSLTHAPMTNEEIEAFVKEALCQS